MSRNLLFGVLTVFLLAGALFLPFSAEDRGAVMQQHEKWPGDQPEVTGFGPNGVLTSHLPLIVLYTDGKEIPGTDGSSDKKLICDYSVIHNTSGLNRSDGVPAERGRMALSVRGNSSRDYAKKQYSVKLVDDANQTVDRSFLGMPPESSWVLNGSLLDVSQMRNYLLYNLSGEIMDYSPRCRLCEVLTVDKNGRHVYQGIYTLIEKIKVSENRLNLAVYDPAHTETSFIVQINPDIDHDVMLHLKPDSISSNRMDLEYPAQEELTDASRDYIQKQLLIFEKALFDAMATGDWTGMEEHIDMESFVDYYIINEFCQNYDAGFRSTYLYKPLGEPFRIGPVWDFDGAFDNFFQVSIRPDYMELASSVFYAALTQAPTFNDMCARRYAELRRDLLSEESLCGMIQDIGDYLGSAAERNTRLWYQKDRAYFEKSLQEMQEYIIARGNWMDENFSTSSNLIG